MKMKRNISIRKILQVALTVIVTTGCIIAMVSASRIEDTQVVKGVAVHIKNAKKYHFIEQNEIMDLAINKRNVDIAHTPFSKLDINSMEQVIKADPWVADAQVYVDNDRMLHIYITQRVPVARLFKQDGSSCYIDSALNIMPLSASYTYYTMVVTNVPGKDIVNGLGARRKIVALATAIHADSFWNAQVSGVALDSVGMFELTPVLGEHKILFGDTARMQEKLGNLLAFYKNVLNRIGWDKYEVLDVRYRNQVIASPSLPYKGPVDKAIESMNWISSIEETEAKKREKDSVDDVEQRYQAALQAAHHKTVPRHVKPVAAQPMVAKKQDKPVAKAAIKPAAKAVVKKTAAKPIPKAAKKKAVAKHADKKQKAVNKGNKKQEKGKQVPKYEYGAPKQRK